MQLEVLEQKDLQCIKARLSLLETEFNARVSDETFDIYKLKGKSELGQSYEYSITFISPHKLEVEKLVDTDVKIGMGVNIDGAWSDFSKSKEVFHVGQVISVIYGLNEKHFNNRVTLQLMVEKTL